MDTVIAGNYKGIQMGANDVRSDYARAAGRAHQAPLAMIEALKNK